MGDSDTIEELVAVLHEAQRLGFLGDRPIEDVVEHARAFTGGLGDLQRRSDGSPRSVLDLGAGGGVPGLVIAFDRPDLQVTLLDRRTKRTDFLQRVVQRLGWQDRVAVASADASTFLERHPHGFDAVVARGFGPPDVTLSLAVRLVRPDGRVVISEPPTGDRWDSDLLDDLDVRRLEGTGRVAVFVHRDAPAWSV